VHACLLNLRVLSTQGKETAAQRSGSTDTLCYYMYLRALVANGIDLAISLSYKDPLAIDFAHLQIGIVVYSVQAVRSTALRTK